MPKRKRQPDNFDVAEFLRESDDDLKSALNSLLRAPEAEDINLVPGTELIPPVKLGVDVKLTDPAKSVPGPELASAKNLAIASARDRDNDPNAGINMGSGLNLESQPKSGPQDNLHSHSILDPPSILDSGAISDPPIKLASERRFAIREMRRAADAHTRAEQHVYERLWEVAGPYDEISRTITIGFGAMANLVGLSESNARINLRSLLAKLAVEEIAEYNCERSQGRTYRIFNEAEILRRRREAGLRWYMRRTLAVVFVDPITGQPLLKNKPFRR